MNVVATIDRYWRPTVPATRLAAVRILVGAFATFYVLGRIGHLLSFGSFAASRFAPIGVVSFVDGPASGAVHMMIVIATILSGVAFTVGWRYRFTAPLFAGLLLWTLSYRSSWGMIFHTENLLVIHVIVLALVPAAAAWSVDARRFEKLCQNRNAQQAIKPPQSSPEYGWPLRLLCLLTVATYVLAGIAKVRYGGSAWVDGEVLKNYVAVDNLRKVLLGSPHSPLAPPLLSSGWLFTVLAALTLVLELGAPVAMVGRRLAAVWVIFVIGFHFGVLALMAIGFPYPMSGIAFVAFFPIERLEPHGRQLLVAIKRRLGRH